MDDREWQAQILLQHQRRRGYRRLLLWSTVGLFVLAGVLFMIYLTVNPHAPLPSSSALGCVVVPLLALPQLAILVIWRCPSCGRSLGNRDPHFCPHCGAQLHFAQS